MSFIICLSDGSWGPLEGASLIQVNRTDLQGEDIDRLLEKPDDWWNGQMEIVGQFLQQEPTEPNLHHGPTPWYSGGEPDVQVDLRDPHYAKPGELDTEGMWQHVTPPGEESLMDSEDFSIASDQVISFMAAHGGQPDFHWIQSLLEMGYMLCMKDHRDGVLVDPD